MAKRLGTDTLLLPTRPVILGRGAVGGKLEGEGPLGKQLDAVFLEADMGEESWEKAEVRLQQAAIRRALDSAGCPAEEVELLFGGDLLNQCSATSFALRELGIPLAGLYSACATFALGVAMAALSVDGGGFRRVMAAASSHFCSAEKQFRFPLEYGAMMTPTAQRTATAAGALLLQSAGEPLPPERAAAAHSVCVEKVLFGRVNDLGVADANSMGAAMAPAAADTILRFLKDTNMQPTDLDCILTGDLGEIGSQLLLELAKCEGGVDLAPVHRDGGRLLYDTAQQDVGVGGSGIGCSAAVLCADVLPKLERGEWQRVLYVGTGALLSVITPLQGESIPAIAHGVLFSVAP
ncbi:MAG: stage V sporulation protein AD [Oscillospiraceae bacterium]|jgi:stage V sporulation protein AD|nr:stage V sporulation protein AD [Oscillospiraceae bacterium]